MKKLLALCLIACLALGLTGCKPKTDYYAMLAEYSDFNCEGAQDVVFSIDLIDPRLAQLEETWGLRAIAGTGDSLSQALNLMHWLRTHTHKVTGGRFKENLNAAEILEYAYDNKKDGLNCKLYSIAFGEMLMALGFDVKVLFCYPAVYKNDNHVVVRVYLWEEARWVMLDPSFDLYVTDEAGRILDAPELRQGLAGRADLRLNEGHAYRGNYFDYMAKDMFYFECRNQMEFGGHNQAGGWVYLLTAGSSVNSEDVIIATYDSFWR